MNGSSWYLAIGMKASFSLSYTVLQGNLGIFKPRVPLELVLGVNLCVQATARWACSTQSVARVRRRQLRLVKHNSSSLLALPVSDSSTLQECIVD